MECLEKCPDNTIHFANSYICSDILQCSFKTIKYSNRECVEHCPKNNTFFKNEDITYCLNNCEEILNLITISNDIFVTYEQECIFDCQTVNARGINGKCECLDLFYYDKVTGYKKCISSTISSCEDYADYPISNWNTKECLYYCSEKLSSNGTICYPNNISCDENEILSTNPNGINYCDCLYNYYYYSNNIGTTIKKCLKKDENCPLSYNYLIKDTREYVSSCPDEIYNIIYGNTCLKNCPTLTVYDESTKTCICNTKYYTDKNNILVCLKKDCPYEYPLMLDDGSKECLSKCPDTKYLDYPNKKCIDNCESLTNKIASISEGDNIAMKYSKNKCRCINNWYYDDVTEEEICSDNSLECKELTNNRFNYIIGSTKQCVLECPENSFIFGNICFKSCNEASEITNKNLIEEENKCICSDYSNFEDITQCLTLEQCQDEEYSIINGKRQCYKKNENKCPNEYPVYFNGYCYKEDQSPTTLYMIQLVDNLFVNINGLMIHLNLKLFVIHRMKIVIII